MSKPGIDELLIASAIDAHLLERLRECPDEVLDAYELTEAERDSVLHPDERLLPLIGAALARRIQAKPVVEVAPPEPPLVLDSATLPEVSLALTVVPCAIGDRYSYAVWVNPLPEGVDPSTLPPPPGSTLPGEPLAPLFAVIRLSPVRLQGGTDVGLWASLTQSTNVEAPAAVQLDTTSDAVQAAAAAVQAAPAAARYQRLLALAHAMQGGVRP